MKYFLLLATLFLLTACGNTSGSIGRFLEAGCEVIPAVIQDIEEDAVAVKDMSMEAVGMEPENPAQP